MIDQIEQSASHCDLAGIASMPEGNREEDALQARIGLWLLSTND
jgi:hypothetical protein